MVGRVLLWIVVGAMAATSLTSVPYWLVARRMAVEQAGGVALVYELNKKSIPTGAAPDELARRTVEVLRRRVDPGGRKNIVWRVVEGPFIEIRVPDVSAQARQARLGRQQAEKELKDAAWTQSELEAVTGKASHAATAAERLAILQAFISEKVAIAAEPAVRKQVEDAERIALGRLVVLTGARQKLDAAKARLEGLKPTDWSAEDLQARNDAQLEYNDALVEVLLRSADLYYVTNVIKAADDPAYEHQEDARKLLAELPTKYPLQRDKIQALISARENEFKLNGGFDEVDALERLVARAGVLDFRIAVLPGEIGADPDAAVQSLYERGPEQQVKANGTTARWFEVDPNGKDNLTRGGYVTANWVSQPYILCYDDHDHTLTHSDSKRKPWAINASNPYNDPASGGVMLPFRLDAVGAAYMGDLTGANKGHPMAILLDDKVMSAPNIHSQINDSGVITFGAPTASHPLSAIQKEARQLQQIMNAGALPATLMPDPISIREIAPLENYRPFPWAVVWTVGPLPVLAAALWLALRPARKAGTEP